MKTIKFISTESAKCTCVVKILVMWNTFAMVVCVKFVGNKVTWVC